jgi:hypothetical protein
LGVVPLCLEARELVLQGLELIPDGGNGQIDSIPVLLGIGGLVRGLGVELFGLFQGIVHLG